MEEIKNRYHNGKIYTIRSPQSEKYYIGSTCLELYKRLWKHRYNKKKYDSGDNKYKLTSFDILQYDDHYIELLEEYKCENKKQLEKREGELIRQHIDNCINRKIEGRTHKQHYEDNKEKLIKQKKN